MTDEAVLTALRARSFPDVVDWKVERRPDWFGDDAIYITAVLDDVAADWDFSSAAVRRNLDEISGHARLSIRELKGEDSPMVYVGIETVSEGKEIEEEDRRNEEVELRRERELLRARLAEVDQLLTSRSPG